MSARPTIHRKGSAGSVSAGPASGSVRCGDLIVVSGQTASQDALGGRPGGAGAETHAIFAQIEELLEAHGAGLDQVVDVVSFHRDVREVDAVLAAAARHLPAPYPAWTALGVTGSAQADAHLTIKVIAHAGGPKEAIAPESFEWIGERPVSAACRSGNLIFVSGLPGMDANGQIWRPASAGEHSRRAYARAAELLAAAGGSLDDVLDITSFHLGPRGMVPSEKAHMEVWSGVQPASAPAWTAIGIHALPHAGTLSQYRLIADISPGPRLGRVSASIHWKDTPNAGASRKEGGTLIAVAGEVASDGEGNVTTPGDTSAQAHYAFNRIREVVEMHGSSMDSVLEITCFHKDPRALETVVEAAAEHFSPGAWPAWTSVGVTGLWNPGYLHEIHALAVV